MKRLLQIFLSKNATGFYLLFALANRIFFAALMPGMALIRSSFLIYTKA